MTLKSLAALATSALSMGSLGVATADVYVDISAVNCATGTGTATDPVCNIADAVAIAAPGDTIHIAPGTYLENLTIPMDLELRGTGGEAVTIVDGGAVDSVIITSTGVALTVDGLTITGGDGDEGGGIRSLGDLTLRNSTVTGNRSSGGGDGGGGIAALTAGTTTTIEDSVVSLNRAENHRVFIAGGGIFSTGSDVYITNSTIDGNLSDSSYPYYPFSDAGGIDVANAQLVIRDSTISNNESSSQGGGIRTFSTRLVLSNVTLSGNTGGTAGGAFVSAPLPNSRVEHMTMLGSTSTYGNVGFHAFGDELLPFRNCVTGGTVSGPDVAGSSVLLAGFNFISRGGSGVPSGPPDDIVGSTAYPLDPMLGPLQDNGGPTLTHEPLPGSPLINGGNPANFRAKDQRGEARPFGGLPDIGAVERVEPPRDVCNGDGGDQMGCTNCPCANNAPQGSIGGCLNSTGAPSRLLASGDLSVSLPSGSTTDFRVACEQSPASALHILVSADAVASQNPMSPCFGLASGVLFNGYDGLRCAVFGLRRHGARTSDANGSIGTTTPPWGGEGAPPAGLAVAFGGFSVGQMRYFQAIFRDDPVLVCMRGLNTSQAIEVEFRP